MPSIASTTDDSHPDDVELAQRIAGGSQAAFETLMREHNGRLFRIARSILRNDAEAEDALQDAYLDAYRHIAEFKGTARLSTWLTRIVVNQALMRLRRQKRDRVIVSFTPELTDGPHEVEQADDAEPAYETLFRAELRRILERRVDELPRSFRTVFVMRDVEDMTVQETAECLSIPAATVRTRLFRARGLLREALARDMDVAAADLFVFGGARCDRIVARVLAHLQTTPSALPAPRPDVVA